jgi:hypothetical protein
MLQNYILDRQIMDKIDEGRFSIPQYFVEIRELQLYLNTYRLVRIYSQWNMDSV